jgi:DNA-binding response OmpR family regulator
VQDQILLIGDEPDITSSVKAGLVIEGFQADTFNNPEKGSLHFNQAYYDDIILDVTHINRASGLLS